MAKTRRPAPSAAYIRALASRLELDFSKQDDQITLMREVRLMQNTVPIHPDLARDVYVEVHDPTVGDEIAFDRWPQDVQALATRVIRARLVEEYEEARDDALAQERAEGYEEGKEVGYEDGREVGYEDGFEDGYAQAEADLTPPQAA